MFSKLGLSLTNLVTYLTPKPFGPWKSRFIGVFTWGYGVMKEKASVCFPGFHLKTVQKLFKLKGFEGCVVTRYLGCGTEDLESAGL